TSCSCSGKAEAGPSHVDGAVQEVASDPAPQHILEHKHPEVARCVAEAYIRAERSERVDGVVSVDRTGLTPRYMADPELPGLVPCVQESAALQQGSTTFRVSPSGDGAARVEQVPK